MRLAELMELLLARIYDLHMGNPGIPVDVDALAREMGEANPVTVMQAVQAMERRGWVQAYIALGPSSHATLTAEGRLFVEQGGETNIISQYRANPHNFIFIQHSPNTQVVVAEPSAKVTQLQNNHNRQKHVLDLISQANEALNTDTALNRASKKDALLDLQTVEAQIQKQLPDKQLIEQVLSRLGNIASIGSLITSILSML